MLINPRIRDEKGLVLENFKKQPLEESLDGNHHVNSVSDQISEYLTYHLPEKPPEKLEDSNTDENIEDDKNFSSSSFEGLSSEEDWVPSTVAKAPLVNNIDGKSTNTGQDSRLAITPKTKKNSPVNKGKVERLFTIFHILNFFKK
jgi:hypothetical protein